LPGTNPRSLKTMALGLAVSRAARVTIGRARTMPIFPEEKWTIARRLTAGRHRRGIGRLCRRCWIPLIVCKFPAQNASPTSTTQAAEIVSRVTGWEYTAAENGAEPASGIHTLKKCSTSAKAGGRTAIGCPNDCCGKPSDGCGPRRRASRDELQEMIRGYYSREWDEDDSFPSGSSTARNRQV